MAECHSFSECSQIARISLWINVAMFYYLLLLKPVLLFFILLLLTPSFIRCFFGSPWDISVKNPTHEVRLVCLHYPDSLRSWHPVLEVLLLTSFQILCSSTETQLQNDNMKTPIFSLFKIANNDKKPKILLQMAELHPSLYVEGSFIDSSKWKTERFLIFLSTCPAEGVAECFGFMEAVIPTVIWY